MDNDNVIRMSRESIAKMKRQSEIRQSYGKRFQNEKVGAITPAESTIEAAEEIGNAGGAVIRENHATGVVIPPRVRH